MVLAPIMPPVVVVAPYVLLSRHGLNRPYDLEEAMTVPGWWMLENHPLFDCIDMVALYKSMKQVWRLSSIPPGIVGHTVKPLESQ
jgi:hypothetical protein